VAHGLLRSPLPQFWDELLRRDEERIALEDAADDDRRVRPHSAAVSIPAAATRRNWSSRWSGFTTRIALSPRPTPPAHGRQQHTILLVSSSSLLKHAPT